MTPLKQYDHRDNDVVSVQGMQEPPPIVKVGAGGSCKACEACEQIVQVMFGMKCITLERV